MWQLVTEPGAFPVWTEGAMGVHGLGAERGGKEFSEAHGVGVEREGGGFSEAPSLREVQ